MMIEVIVIKYFRVRNLQRVFTRCNSLL